MTARRILPLTHTPVGLGTDPGQTMECREVKIYRFTVSMDCTLKEIGTFATDRTEIPCFPVTVTDVDQSLNRHAVTAGYKRTRDKQFQQTWSHLTSSSVGNSFFADSFCPLGQRAMSRGNSTASHIRLHFAPFVSFTQFNHSVQKGQHKL